MPSVNTAGRSRERLAALDLGSNSFRLWIAELDEAGRLHQLANFKQPVRLAAGISANGELTEVARQRALEVVEEFSRIIRQMGIRSLRAVATSTFRVASNAADLLVSAEEILSVPVEVVSGLEEARLIYKGASRQLDNDGLDRLVIDIGGGSTECIIGNNGRAKMVDSAVVGCVGLSRQFFPEGRVSAEAMNMALFRARDFFTPIVAPYKALGWRTAFGTSGTAKSLTQVAQTHFGSAELTRSVLDQMIHLLVKAGHVDELHVDGLKPERRPVLAGGLAVMTAAFDEFGIESLRYCQGALRQGALYDLLERREGQDIQAASVEMMMRRYSVDTAHAARLSGTSQALLERIVDVVPARFIGSDYQGGLRALIQASSLAEIGLVIAHEDFNKHSSYILSQADIPGFSKPEQRLLARLTQAQYGPLHGLRDQVRVPGEWVLMMCLRWSSILNRQRHAEVGAMPEMRWNNGRLLAVWPKLWAERHALTQATLVHEVNYWNNEALEPRIELSFA